MPADGGHSRQHVEWVQVQDGVLFVSTRHMGYASDSGGLNAFITAIALPSTMMHRSEQERLLLQALRKIPLELQTALELRYWEELNSSEIAEVLGVAATTIRSRLRRARTLLEQALRESSPQGELVESTIRDLEAWADAV